MRCVHLDFHTSPLIEEIGVEFDKEEFTRTLVDAKVELVTVFAKCHHGYCYYPTKVGTMHPHLKFDLLGAEIEAIHAAGAKAPIYITMGWNKKDADEHPEWRHVNFKTRQIFSFDPEWEVTAPEAPLPDCRWTTLCPAGGYGDYLAEVTREVCEMYDVSDGIFYDICFIQDACACEACLAGMRERGLDPDSYEDAKRYYTDKRIEMMKRLTGIVHEYSPDAPVFYNGGANMNRPEFHPYQTHFEMEDLPTSWGGYDLMPLRAKFFEKYGKRFLGMTGKFHTTWGEFGGFKNREALRYECVDMLSVGASISVGDHLHPSGRIDRTTYALLGHAFDYVEKLEPYAENTSAYTDIGLWISHNTGADMGASKILQGMHLEFDVIVSGDPLDRYRCIILPEHTTLTDEDRAALSAYVARGGALVAAYDSIPDGFGVEKLAPSEYDQDYIEYAIDECQTPFLAYGSAYRTRSEGEVLAKVYEPFFSRTNAHFCGHKNTPYRLEPAEYPALTRCGRVLYFAHHVFTSFEKTGSYFLERYIADAIGKVYERGIVTENLPSAARVRLRKSEEGRFYALHTLYSPPINRGNVCLLSDFPTLHGVGYSLRVGDRIRSVTAEPAGTEIPFTQEGDTVRFTLPPFSLHSLVVLHC